MPTLFEYLFDADTRHTRACKQFRDGKISAVEFRLALEDLLRSLIPPAAHGRPMPGVGGGVAAEGDRARARVYRLSRSARSQ